MRRCSTIPFALLLLQGFVQAQLTSPSAAIALQQQGRWADAAQVWEKVVKNNPRDASAFASLGVALAKQEKYSEAAGAYRRALALNPRLPGIELDLGLAEFKQGHFQSAIAPLKAAVALDQSEQAGTLLGLSYYGAKNFAEAANYLEAAAKADPTNAELNQYLAQSCLWAKKYQCTLDAVQRVLDSQPDSAAAHTLTGEALDGLDRTKQAIAELETAVKVAPQEPNVHFGLGYLYWKNHELDEAQHEFQNELALDPKHAQATAYLGDIQMKKGDPDGALTLLQKSVQLNSNLRFAFMDLGIVLAQKKNYDDALAAFQKAAKLDPAQPDAHYRMARIYQLTGRKAESDREFAIVVKLHQTEDDKLAVKMPLPPAPQ